MRKLLLSVALIGIGAGTWLMLTRSARFSIKKWDAKFEAQLRHKLNNLGVGDQDILSNVHEILKDANGEWVVQRLSLKLPDAGKQKQVLENLEEAGGMVEQKIVGKSPVYLVKRGSRVYQEISFAP